VVKRIEMYLQQIVSFLKSSSKKS